MSRNRIRFTVTVSWVTKRRRASEGLSDTEFTSDSTNYTVKQLTFWQSRFYAVLDPDPGSAADNWVLHLGDDVTISFSDAGAWTYCRAGPGPCSPVRVAGGYRWRSPGFSWTADNENDTISVSLVSVPSNNEPTVANAIPNQRAEVDKAFSYTFPANTFSDSDNHGLSYKVVPADGGILGEAGGVLPDWLSFDASTRTFSGTPKSEDRGVVRVRVTAYDGHGGSVWDTFYITVYRSSRSGMRVRDGFLHGLNGPGGGAMPWMPWSLGTESSSGSGPSGSPRSGTAVESCRVNVDVRFLDANGDAVEVDSLTASDFTVENGSVGTPVKSDSVWRVTVTADPGYSGAMRVRLQSREPFVLPDPDHSEIEFSEMEAELWEASELVFRVSAGDSDCAPVARNALSLLALDGLELDPSFDAATTAYAAAAESDTAQVTVTASAVYGAASVAFAPGDADTEADGHQVALGEGRDRGGGHGDARGRERGADVRGDGNARGSGGGGAGGRGDAGAGRLEPGSFRSFFRRPVPSSGRDLDQTPRAGEQRPLLQRARADGGGFGPHGHPEPRPGLHDARLHERRGRQD